MDERGNVFSQPLDSYNQLLSICTVHNYLLSILQYISIPTITLLLLLIIITTSILNL